MKHTEETKKLLSEKRKQWLKDNPDKHPWRNKDKFKSEPCEKVKEFLRELNIEFIGEFDPEIEGRSFSVDIALPDKMIALEVNGNQHYEKNGKLKPYYQERHDLLVNAGWNVFEIHYSACYNLDKWNEFVCKIKESPKLQEFDYFTYVPRSKKEWLCLDCGGKISKGSKRCRPCHLLFCENNKQNFCIDCGIFILSRSKRCKDCHSNKTKKPRKRITKLVSYCSCGELKQKKSKKCITCYTLESCSINKPTKEELENLVWTYPFTSLGKIYNVSDNAVRKWCKSYGITDLPSRGYFLRK